MIENVMGTVRRVCRHVKRWRLASMAMCGTAAAERLGGLEVRNHLELGRKLNGEIPPSRRHFTASQGLPTSIFWEVITRKISHKYLILM
jgi:hypothetical protein